MATRKPQVKAYIDPEIKEKFKSICDIEKRSESNMIEYLIDRYVKEYEAQQTKKQESGSNVPNRGTSFKSKIG